MSLSTPHAPLPNHHTRFADGAPVDRFEITNLSTSVWSIQSVDIILAGSRGQLYFDPTAQGEGLSVSQPFRSAGGNAALETVSPLRDGGRSIALKFSAFAPGADYLFTTDVDDRMPSGAQTMVSGDEVSGAGIAVTFISNEGQVTKTGVFDATGVAKTEGGSGCV